MKKRVMLTALLCGALLLCSGCRAFSSLRTIIQSLHIASFESDKYLSEFQDNWCYRQLDEDMQADYGDLYTALTDGWGDDRMVTVNGDTTVSGPGDQVRLSHPLSSEEEVRQLFLSFTNDNPQFFHLEKHYGLYGFRTDGGFSYESLTLLYTMTAGERQAAKAEIETKTADILQQAATVSDAFDRELLLHDWLAAACSYDRRSDKELTHAYTMYGALVEGRAVCEGYARAMQWLLRQSNMESTLVIGYDPDGQAHMWNLVNVDGMPYHLDVTWDDTDDLPRHNYFNLTTAETEKSHRISDDNIGLVDCTATEANFYRHTGRWVDTYSRQEIAAIIAAEVQAGAESVELRFAEGKLDNALLFIQSGNFFFDTMNAALTDGQMWPFELYVVADEGILMLNKSSAF